MRNRLFYLIIGLSLIATGCNRNKQANEGKTIKIWYNKPAVDWFESLPLGNGRLGAMITGDPGKDLIQLNEESLWAGCPENPYPEDIREHYSNYQQLNLEGKYEKARDYGLKNLTVRPTSIRSYEPLGDLTLSFGHQEPLNYRRELDLETGISSVQYEINGSRIKRETFISTEYDALFYRFESLGQSTSSCKIHFDRVKDVKISALEDRLDIEGQIFDDPEAYDDNPGGSGKGGMHMKFNVQVGLTADNGEVTVTDSGIVIENTKAFTLVLSAATDYNLEKLDFDRSIDPRKKTNALLENSLDASYKEVRKAHIESHSKVFNRVRLELTDQLDDTIPTDTRIENLRKDLQDPYLVELMFQYGRYLLMSSSGGRAVLPSNLQGIWNRDMWAAWEADYHLNINLQMNYWPADLCNLSETFVPLSAFLYQLAGEGQTTAMNFIGSEGWMAHHVANVFGRVTPSGSTPGSQLENGYSFPLAGAWMCLSTWRHFEFTRDEEYLSATAYPLIDGAARFMLDFLVEDESGMLVTAPSYSPENAYIHPVSGIKLRNTVASALDMQIIRDVFRACTEAERILGIDKLSKEINDALNKIPGIMIGADGTIQEWNEDYEDGEPGHRHISHLYALHPSNQITEETSDLFEAARKTIEKRLAHGGAQTGWSRAWNVNFYARLFDGDACLHHINTLLKTRVSNNLFDLHPSGREPGYVFQIDGNFGVTAGIAEMLVQSHEPGIIRLLPALPSTWPEGSVKGLKARGNFIIDIKWNHGRVIFAEIFAGSGGEVKLIYNNKSIMIELGAGESYIVKETF